VNDVMRAAMQTRLTVVIVAMLQAGNPFSTAVQAGAPASWKRRHEHVL
jgi:hypothetical protein